MAAKPSSKPRMSTFFVPGTGIDREVITTDICRYLGNDALVKPGPYQDPRTGEVRQGYYVTAYRALTTEQLADLKADSLRWDAERRKNPQNNRNQGFGDGYKVSATRRQQWPTDPVPSPFPNQSGYSQQGQPPPPPQREPQARSDYDRQYRDPQMGPSTSSYSEFSAPPESYSYQVSLSTIQGTGAPSQPNQAQPRAFPSNSSYQGDGRGAPTGYGVGRGTTFYDSSGQSMTTAPIPPTGQQQVQYPGQRQEHVHDQYYRGGQGPTHEEEFFDGEGDDQMQYDDAPQMPPGNRQPDREPAKNSRHRHGHRS